MRCSLFLEAVETYADGFILQKGRQCRYCLALRTVQECVEYIYQYLAFRCNNGIWNMESQGDVNGLGEKESSPNFYGRFSFSPRIS